MFRTSLDPWRDCPEARSSHIPCGCLWWKCHIDQVKELLDSPSDVKPTAGPPQLAEAEPTEVDFSPTPVPEQVEDTEVETNGAEENPPPDLRTPTSHPVAPPVQTEPPPVTVEPAAHAGHNYPLRDRALHRCF